MYKNNIRIIYFLFFLLRMLNVSSFPPQSSPVLPDVLLHLLTSSPPSQQPRIVRTEQSRSLLLLPPLVKSERRNSLHSLPLFLSIQYIEAFPSYQMIISVFCSIWCALGSTMEVEYWEFLLSCSVLSPFLSKCWPIISLPPSLSNVNYPDRPHSVAGSSPDLPPSFLYNK